ncbi:MAG: Crp/Fnr family transcriptional regulator [Sediminibacterium sp.]|nr:Crp/Fnr family transcriptional regulator [Sediminibacterium sp.]
MNTITDIFLHNTELKQELEKHARLKRIKKGDIILNPGDEVLFIPIVQKGAIRIIRQDTSGAEVFLYHIYPLQTCTLSLTCCYTGKPSSIKAIAETDSELILIPSNLIDTWNQYPEWKTYINNSYSSRFSELIQVIDLMAFNNMDKQLQHYLEERCKALNTSLLEITHQEIADELHAHREAISRLLRHMEQKKMVKLGRNSIEVLLKI